MTPPTLDSMRERLGGRVTGSAGVFRVGSVVALETATGGQRHGVVLCNASRRVDVFLERGLVKRTDASTLSLHVGPPPSHLAEVATQASVFATLFEGQWVHVERGPGSSTRGIVREKCRYGALVQIEGGAMLGVGFQRLWPAPSASEEPA